MKIESINNNHVKEWTKLQNKKYRDVTGLFLVEGEHLIKEAEKNNLIKEIISLDESLNADYYVTTEIMKKISTQVSISKRVAVCFKKKELEIGSKLLILDGIQDPGNLGTIIRSATAFGFKDIILSEDSVDLYNEKVIRASEGMIFNINILRRNLSIFLDSIKNNYTIYITDVENGKNICDIKNIKNIALVIGSEGQGVKESIKSYANYFIKIQMDSTCESLNAGVAASILMYEIMKEE